ncbi:MAG: transposase [Lachnospirales bacterium]
MSIPLRSYKRVETIIIDIYTPYVTLIKKVFPNSKLIIDKFHSVQNFSKDLNKTRIKIMNNNKKYYIGDCY